MSKKYKVPDYICVIKAIGIKYCYEMSSINKAMKKVKKLAIILETHNHFRIGITNCGQDCKTGKVYLLVPHDDDVTINGIKHGDFKTGLFDSVSLRECVSIPLCD